jgi:ABC-type sugar transport system ATPase subunit
MAAVTFDTVVKRYGDVPVVHGLDLEIHDGELLVLVGGSGCGKSTTLRMLAGLEEVTSGTIRIGERDVTALPPGKRDVAMVFQDYALYPHLTARENIGLGLKLRKMPTAEVARRVAWAADVLDLAPLLDRKPRAMSGGQRQRVAMGRAMVREPSVFLFDEPLSNLDAKLRGQMRVEIGKLQQRLGTTMLYVTHDQVEAMTLAHRLVVLDAGHVQQMGAPDEVYDAPANRFVAEFIGSPPMNFVEGTVELRPEGPSFVSEELRVSLPPRRFRDASEGSASLGIRPEALSPAEAHPDRPRLSGKLVLVERLGPVSHLHVERGSSVIIASVSGTVATIPPADVDLAIDPELLHLFGADGASLRTTSAG